MAEGFLKHFAKIEKLNVEVRSGGTRPAGYVHPLAIQVMAEQGLDISRQESKGIQPAELSKFDYVISMGCSDKEICPVNLGGVSRDWSIVDPFGHPVEFYRQVREEIQQRVQLLAQELTKL